MEAENSYDRDMSSKTELAKAEGGDRENKKRGQWGGQLEFILTCVGYAVGLGNVWRFPYLCYKNGGGAFLIPYVIMLLFVGLPLFFMELAFGQFASLGPITIWKINPLFKGLGYAMVIVSYLISLYYNVIVAWCLYYFFMSMTDVLPWIGCDNWWNTDKCSSGVVNTTSNTNFTTTMLPATTAANMTSHVLSDNKTFTPSEEYFNNYVLGLTSGIDVPGGMQWGIAGCLLLAWAIVLLVLIKGIKTLGKVVYFTAIFPYILLTILLVRGATLEGSLDGVLYYIKPDIARLSDASVWSDAAVQIFYSLSVGTGGLIAMASFNKFNNNCLRDAFIVPFINCGTSIFAGFVIFSVLGFMAHEKGVAVKDVAADGPGLAFVVYPEGLSKMPVAPMWAILFFFMMTVLGFSSQFSMMETVISALIDELGLRKNKKHTYIFRVFICVISFGLGVPMAAKSGMYLLHIMDTFVGGFPLLVIGLLECVTLMYIYGYTKFNYDINLMLGNYACGLRGYFMATWCVLTPLIILAIIVFKSIQTKPLMLGTYLYPEWGEMLGWLMCLFPIVMVPIWFVFKFLKEDGWQIIRRFTMPTNDWGPASDGDRKGSTYNSLNDMEGDVNFSLNIDEDGKY